MTFQVPSGVKTDEKVSSVYSWKSFLPAGANGEDQEWGKWGTVQQAGA